MAQQMKRDHKVGKEKMPPTLTPSTSLPNTSAKLHPIDEARKRQQELDLQQKPINSLFTGKPVKEQPLKPHTIDDNFNQNAMKFANDPWVRDEPLAFTTSEDDKMYNTKTHDKKQQQKKTETKEKIQHQIDNPRNEKKSKQFTKIPGSGENRDVMPFDDDNECFQFDESSSSSSSEEPVKIGDLDDPESSEEGEDFALPDRILVDQTPFLPYIYRTICSALLIKSWYNTTLHAISTLTTIKLDPFNLLIVSGFITARYAAGFYSFLQSHYLAPQAKTYLIKNGKQVDPVKRHEKNRLTRQTVKDFRQYDYHTEVELPIKHWAITVILSAVNWVSSKIRPYIPVNNIISNVHREIKIPKTFTMPSYMRSLTHNRFYEIRSGVLKPKKLIINADLLQRIMTTKAINYHQPIDQQMKTINALVNNQSDINLSDQEFGASTVSDTLTLAKFQLLNKTSEVAEMGFDLASIQLQASMVIDTTQLLPNGGLRSHQPRSPPLGYEPPEILVKGLIALGLFSAISVSLFATSVYLTRTSLIRLDQSSEKLRGLLLRYHSLNLGLKDSITGYYSRWMFPKPSAITILRHKTIPTPLKTSSLTVFGSISRAIGVPNFVSYVYDNIRKISPQSLKTVFRHIMDFVLLLTYPLRAVYHLIIRHPKIKEEVRVAEAIFKYNNSQVAYGGQSLSDFLLELDD